MTRGALKGSKAQFIGIDWNRPETGLRQTWDRLVSDNLVLNRQMDILTPWSPDDHIEHWKCPKISVGPIVMGVWQKVWQNWLKWIGLMGSLLEQLTRVAGWPPRQSHLLHTLHTLKKSMEKSVCRTCLQNSDCCWAHLATLVSCHGHESGLLNQMILHICMHLNKWHKQTLSNNGTSHKSTSNWVSCSFLGNRLLISNCQARVQVHIQDPVPTDPQVK